MNSQQTTQTMQQPGQQVAQSRTAKFFEDLIREEREKIKHLEEKCKNYDVLEERTRIMTEKYGDYDTLLKKSNNYDTLSEKYKNLLEKYNEDRDLNILDFITKKFQNCKIKNYTENEVYFTFDNANFLISIKDEILKEAFDVYNKECETVKTMGKADCVVFLTRSRNIFKTNLEPELVNTENGCMPVCYAACMLDLVPAIYILKSIIGVISRNTVLYEVNNNVKSISEYLDIFQNIDEEETKVYTALRDIEERKNNIMQKIKNVTKSLKDRNDAAPNNIKMDKVAYKFLSIINSTGKEPTSDELKEACSSYGINDYELKENFNKKTLRKYLGIGNTVSQKKVIETMASIQQKYNEKIV